MHPVLLQVLNNSDLLVADQLEHVLVDFIVLLVEVRDKPFAEVLLNPAVHAELVNLLQGNAHFRVQLSLLFQQRIQLHLIGSSLRAREALVGNAVVGVEIVLVLWFLRNGFLRYFHSRRHQDDVAFHVQDLYLFLGRRLSVRRGVGHRPPLHRLRFGLYECEMLQRLVDPLHQGLRDFHVVFLDRLLNRSDGQ